MSEMVTMAKPMPLPTGANLQTVSGLDCENWPRAVSIMYIGLPAKYKLGKAKPSRAIRRDFKCLVTQTNTLELDN